MLSKRSDGEKSHRFRLRFGLRCALVAMIVATGAGQAFAECTELQKLTASDAAASDGFGWSVSVSAETAVVGGQPFSISLGMTGAFPNFRRPRVLWIGADEGGKQLELLAQALDQSLRQVGFDRPDRPFRSHLTVGRVRDEMRAQKVVKQFAEREVRGTFEVRRVVVVHSTLDPQGSVYRPLKEVSLGAPGAHS